MKITIEIDKTTATAMKKCLQQLHGIAKPTKDDVQQYIQEMVNDQLENGENPMSDYVNAFRNPYEPG